MERLQDEILAAPQRRISFARFMERALTEPDLGYYATSDRRPTREGDFLTAPELHPFFGRCLGRFLAAAWERLGAPGRSVVREFGAGRGTLRDSVMIGLRDDASGLAHALVWEGVDLPARGWDGPASGAARPREPMSGIVLANEFVDALPVHRVVRRAGALVECHVGWRDGWFCEIEAEPSTPALHDHLVALGVALSEGQRADISLAAPAWLSSVAAELADGVILVIDYGHPASELYGGHRRSGSLLTYRDHHAGDDPFAAVGRQDITAHVDLTALERAAHEAGLVLLGSTTQARFLADLGLGRLLAELGEDPATDPGAYLEARSAVARYVDPRHLGGFRVVAWGRGLKAGPAPAGFTAP